MSTPAPLQRLSICVCGFGTWRDELPLGKVYNLNLATVKSALYKCGGCGWVQRVDCVQSEPDGLFIPKGLFFPLARTEEQAANRESEKSANL